MNIIIIHWLVHWLHPWNIHMEIYISKNNFLAWKSFFLESKEFWFSPSRSSSSHRIESSPASSSSPVTDLAADSLAKDMEKKSLGGVDEGGKIKRKLEDVSYLALGIFIVSLFRSWTEIVVKITISARNEWVILYTYLCMFFFFCDKRFS